MKKLISILTPCRNEEGNVLEVYQRVKQVFDELSDYRYEHIFIDNASSDRTTQILKGIAKTDPNVKIIINARDFGIARSGGYVTRQASGDAAIVFVADLQDPPHLIKDLIKKWEDGYKIVLAVKDKSEESGLMFAVRKFYYGLYNRISDVKIVTHFCGFGLYDKKIIELLREMDDAYPDLRTQLSEIGYERAIITYTQPERKAGRTKNNFYSLYDQAMLGITSNSKVPLRLASFIGFGVAIMNILVALGYFIYKLLFWNSFQVGIAPLVIGIFFFGGVQLFFLGIIGEYVGAIFTQVKKRPLVIEKERINF